jgi:hypothetical protein
MTTSDLTFAFADDRAPSLPKHRVASEKLAIAVLTLAFLLSYLQYCFERGDLVRLAPVVMLSLGAFVYLLICSRERRQEVLLAAFRPATWMIIAGVSIPPLLSSLYRHTAFSFEYGLVMIVMLLVARILLSGIGFEDLLLAFFYATTAGILIVVAITFSDLLASIGAARYAPLQFDPNRIGFLCRHGDSGAALVCVPKPPVLRAAGNRAHRVRDASSVVARLYRRTDIRRGRGRFALRFAPISVLRVCLLPE